MKCAVCKVLIAGPVEHRVRGCIGSQSVEVGICEACWAKLGLATVGEFSMTVTSEDVVPKFLEALGPPETV